MSDKRRWTMKGKNRAPTIAGLIVLGFTLSVLLSLAPLTLASPAKAIKIGGQSITSGPLGEYGRMMKDGAVMAIEEINAAGGVLGRPLELKWMDTELKPAIGVKNARYLVTQWGADYLMGVDSSGVSMAVGPVLPELNRIFTFCHAATHRLTEELVYEKGIKQIFRVSVPVYQDSIAMALLARDEGKFPGIKRIAGINPDYEYGHVSWALFKYYLKKYRPDVEFVYAGWAPFGTLDFTRHISAAMAQKPDAIYSTEWGGELVSLVKQALAMGVFDGIKAFFNPMGGGGPDCRGFGMEVKKDAFKGKYWTTGRYVWNWPETPKNKEFVERYNEKYGVPPVYSALNAYDAVYLLKAGAEKAGSIETEKLIKAMEGMKLESPAGTKYIRPEDHQAVYTVPLGRLVWDENYKVPKIGDLVVIPAKEYYRSPPFTPIPAD
jgi:branched-chain amino acid transport system substrate-binding protein